MSVIESVIENVVVGEVEKIVKPKVAKLQVKYERLYMSLFTVLNSFCIPAETEGDFVLKKEDMRKILDAVEFYSDDVSLHSVFMEVNILSNENVKSVRKLMKEERYEWKVENGLVEKKKKKRGGKSSKSESGMKGVVNKVKGVVEKKEKKVSKKKEVKEVMEGVVEEKVSVSEVVEEKVSVSEVVEEKVSEVMEGVVKGKVKKDKVKNVVEKVVVNVEDKLVVEKVDMEEKRDMEPTAMPKLEDIPKKKHVKKPKKQTELVTDLPLTH